MGDIINIIISRVSYIQEFVLGGGGNFVSGEQWVCAARLPRGGSGGPLPETF